MIIHKFENHKICSIHQLKQVEINPTAAKMSDIFKGKRTPMEYCG